MEPVFCNRMELQHVYRLQQQNIQLPRPVAFYSQFEKDAYKKNRVVETRLHARIKVLNQQQILYVKDVRCQVGKFKIDKTSFIRAYLAHKTNNTVKRIIYPKPELLPVVQKSERQRKFSVFVHSSDTIAHPLTGLISRENNLKVSDDSVSTVKRREPIVNSWTIRPQTTNPHQPKRSVQRSKSADPRLSRASHVDHWYSSDQSSYQKIATMRGVCFTDEHEHHGYHTRSNYTNKQLSVFTGSEDNRQPNKYR